MNKSRVLFLILSVCIVLPLLGSGLVFGAPTEDGVEGDSIYKYLSIFREVLKYVREAYVEEADIRALMAGALDGASDALDPLSVFVPEEQIDEYRRSAEVGSARSGLFLLKDRGVAYVVAVEEGSPGDEAGIRQGDIVSEIGGVSTRSMPLWQIRQTLAAPVGTEVLFELVRGGEAEELSFQLADFEPSAVSVSELDGVQVLRIPSIGEATVAGVKSALSSLDGPLLLDLRGVAGGDAEVAYDVAELFAQGDLGQLKSRDKTLATYSSEIDSVWTGQLGVLVDHGTQGASEVVVAVLQQKADAMVLGNRSFGHAGVAEQINLSDGLLELTAAFFTGPDGEMLNEGLAPDVRVNRLRTTDEEEGDAFLERAVELLLSGEPEDERKVA
ncbi:MAG: S41 family peptidase [Acidobacteriota bacterium]